MDTKTIRTALHVLGDHVDAKLADKALADLDAVDVVLDKAALRAVDERAALRDTFAAAALTGILAAKHGGWDGPEGDAKKAYQYADAMLKAREAK